MAQAEYTGYEVELFRRVAAMLAQEGYTEWEEGRFEFKCVDYDFIFTDLQSAGPHVCDVGMGGVEDLVEARQAGMRYSVPTYKGGDLLLIYAPAKTNLWTWANPFSIGVWLAFFASSFVIAIVVYFMDMPSPLSTLLLRTSTAGKKLKTLQWASIGLLLQANFGDFNVYTIGARVAVIAYALVVLILVATYIAVFSAQLTVSSFDLNIKGVGDVANKPVGVFEASQEQLSRYGLRQMIPLPWNTREDEEDMIRRLKKGDYAALLIDAPFAMFSASRDCSLHAVGSYVRSVSFAYAFPNDTTFEYIETFDKVLSALARDGVEEELWNQYVAVESICGAQSDDLADAQITIQQLGGLWILMAAGIGLGFILNLGLWVYRKYAAPLTASCVTPIKRRISRGGSMMLDMVPEGGMMSEEGEVLQMLRTRVALMDDRMEEVASTCKQACSRLERLESVLTMQCAMLQEMSQGLGSGPLTSSPSHLLPFLPPLKPSAIQGELSAAQVCLSMRMMRVAPDSAHSSPATSRVHSRAQEGGSPMPMPIPMPMPMPEGAALNPSFNMRPD